MINFKNYITIYTDINNKYLGNIMKKVCTICSVPKELSFFYKRQRDCKDCWNRKRRENYKKSVCGYCKIEFRPGIEGRYKFCSEKCRFLIKVKVDDVTKCWLWQGSLQKKKYAYGTFVPIGERSGLAHRASYRIFKGPLEDNLLVLHSCHNYICVSPDHLRLGTHKDNTKDKLDSGRMKPNYGEKNGFSKLTLKKVKKIKELHKEGYSNNEISSIYGIYHGHVGKIVRKELWKNTGDNHGTD